MTTFSILAEATDGGSKIDLYLFPAVAVAIAVIIWLFLWYFWRDCSDEGLPAEVGGDTHPGRVSVPAVTDSTSAVAVGESPRQSTNRNPGTAASSPVKPSAIETAATAASGADVKGGTTKAEHGKMSAEFKTATEEQAAAQFAGELTEGSVRQDPVYGILYVGRPDAIDDLKLIKGVANVLEGKLNEIGVYRFKQVAVWTEPACREFSKMMTSFKDRIYRDNWIAQAKQFHFDKYGENL